jgi:hypothetical protein
MATVEAQSVKENNMAKVIKQNDEKSLPLAPAGRNYWGKPFQRKELTKEEIAKRREEHLEAQRAYSRTLAWNRYRMGNGPKPTEPEYTEEQERARQARLNKVSRSRISPSSGRITPKTKRLD